MKIAWIVPGFSSDESDWCIPALLDLTRALAARHELHVFALRYPYRRDRYRVYDAVVHAIGGGHRGRWTLPGVWRATLAELSREHRAAPFDVIHAFWVYEPGVIAAWLKRRLGMRTIVSLAGGELIHLPAIQYGLADRRWRLGAMRWALHRADVVAAGSTAMLALARHAANVGADRSVFAPLGVDTKMFSLPEVTPVTDPQHQTMQLLNVGSLQAVKGQADLLRAFRRVVDRMPEARLSIAGSGELEAELKSLAAELRLSDRVAFGGDVRHERLADLFRSATLFVQSSLHEAQGMAMLEAAACGLPIVGTTVGALADLAPDAALASPPGDPARLAEAILALLSDPDRRRVLSQAACARVEAVYALDVVMNRFEALYRS